MTGGETTPRDRLRQAALGLLIVAIALEIVSAIALGDPSTVVSGVIAALALTSGALAIASVVVAVKGWGGRS